MLAEIVLTGGSIYALSVYRKQSKKKQISEFLYSESESLNGHHLNGTRNSLTRLRNKLPSVISQTREQQLNEVLDRRERTKGPMEKQVDKTIKIGLVSGAFALAGSLLYKPLGLLSIPGLIWAGLPIYGSAWRLLKQGKVSVATIITIVVIGCILKGYFLVGALAILLNNVSRKLLIKLTDDSKDRLIDVFRQHPDTVWVSLNGLEVETPFEQIEAGQIVVVNAGEVIPVDGMITEGTSSVDQQILTGESQPVERGVGDQVFASTIVLAGRICIAVEKAGEETTVAKIGDILNRTTEYKAKAQLRAETLADKTVMPTLIAGAIALPIIGTTGALAVIYAHFKNKMSVIAPISVMNYLNITSQHSILIKDGRTLDLLNEVDTIVFDKTGTLTEEQPHVRTIHRCANCEEDEVLAYAAAAEGRQTHPIAKAILEEAESRRLTITTIDEADYKIGYGLTVAINGTLIHVGSSRFMEMMEIEMPPKMVQTQMLCHEQGHSLVMVARDNQMIGAIELSPTIRPEAKQVINELRHRSKIKHMYIISGDHETPTKMLAEELGIEHYFAETLPENKADIIEQLKEEGKFVCYIGDGINDAIALKTSQVSISLRGASTVATDTAQIVLMDGKLHQLGLLFDFAGDFHTNTNVTFAAVVLPMIIGIGGAFFLNFGIAAAIVLNLVGWIGGVSNAMIPLLKFESKSRIKALTNGRAIAPRQLEKAKPADIETSNATTQGVLA